MHAFGNVHFHASRTSFTMPKKDDCPNKIVMLYLLERKMPKPHDRKDVIVLRKFARIIFSRLGLVGLLLALQVFILVFGVWKLSQYFFYFYVGFWALSIFVVLWLINTRDNPSYKLAWAIPILLFPVFGGLFYLLLGGKRMTKHMRKKVREVYETTIPLLRQDPQTLEELQFEDKDAINQVKYIASASLFPVYKDTYTEYFPSGEAKFERLKEELEKAERFIFLEYFIIQEGVMWNTILEILARKVKQGVEVRVMYDDMGCLMTLPYKYANKLRAMGIKCEVFNPFRPELTALLNNRDHRKIVVIDGSVGFTGGINLADEYINVYEKHGHWKDTALMLKGPAVWNLTMMFLQIWGYSAKCGDDFEKYRPEPQKIKAYRSCKGFVLPYGDSPLDDEDIGETVYLNLINKAKHYIYINTPYLIIDNELTVALCTAAKSGVDVRIVTPHIADKWYVHVVTQAYYPQLIEAGVKIFEYTPGFVHAKTFVVDDEYATVGTINMDYRSLYLHFECGVWLYRTDSIARIKEDYLKTLEVCQRITPVDYKHTSRAKRLLQAILRVFAPLM